MVLIGVYVGAGCSLGGLRRVARIANGSELLRARYVIQMGDEACPRRLGLLKAGRRGGRLTNVDVSRHFENVHPY
jgi:hypothetical protein